MPDANNRRLWLISGVLVPLVGALIAAVPLWIEVIHPKINNNDKPEPTAVVVIDPTSTPSADILVPGLLQITDFPTGWAATERRIVEEPCGLHITRQGMIGTTIAYEATDALGSAYLYQEVSQQYPGEGAAMIDYVASVIDSCPSSTSTSPDGTLVDSAVLPLVFPQLGEQSYAFREIVPGLTQHFTTDTILVRRHDYVTILTITNLGAPTDSTFDLFVEAAARSADVRLTDITQ